MICRKCQTEMVPVLERYWDEVFNDGMFELVGYECPNCKMRYYPPSYIGKPGGEWEEPDPVSSAKAEVAATN